MILQTGRHIRYVLSPGHAGLYNISLYSTVAGWPESPPGKIFTKSDKKTSPEILALISPGNKDSKMGLGMTADWKSVTGPDFRTDLLDCLIDKKIYI